MPVGTIMAAFDEENSTMKQGIHPNYKQTVYVEPAVIGTNDEVLPTIGLTINF